MPLEKMSVPSEVIDRESGRTEVKAHRSLKSLQGDGVSDVGLWHIYTIQSNLLERLDILEADGNTEDRSAAFADRGHEKPT